MSGVGVTALTGGAALPALVAGVKAACVAGVVSAGTSATTTAVRSTVSGDSFSTAVKKSAKAAADGFANGFMAGGIAAGVSQVASGGFKIAAKLGAETGKNGGINIGINKILSPDAVWHKNNGGTLLKIGKTFRIDVGSNTLLHMHLPNISSHIQIGTIVAGFYGGLIYKYTASSMVKDGISDISISIDFPENQIVLSLLKEKYGRMSIKDKLRNILAD